MEAGARVMGLAELCRLGDLVLIKDARIASLGFVDIPLEGRLVFAGSRSFLHGALGTTGIAAILTTAQLAATISDGAIGVACADDPRRAFADLHNALVDTTNFYGEMQPTVVADDVSIHARAFVDDHGVALGRRCRIEAGAVVLRSATLADDVRVMPGAVIGSDGFQVMKFGDDLIDLKHAGGVVLGPRSVVMANAVIARAVFRQSTTIGADCRIGNGAFVSHNVQIGDRTLIGHGAIVAGNCRIGEGVTIGPGAVCLDRLEIGDGAHVTAGAVVTKSVPAGERVSGNFAIPHARLVRAVKAAADGAA